MTQTMDTFTKRTGVRMTATKVDARPDPADTWDATARHFRCTLRTAKGRMVVWFSQGSAHTEPPTVEDVLDCLASDASSIENARGFEEWCGDYGYDADSRTAERTYRAIKRQMVGLRRLFTPDDFQALMFDTERL